MLARGPLSDRRARRRAARLARGRAHGAARAAGSSASRDAAIGARQPIAAPPLNDEQRAAADALIAARGFAPFLLDGVTGSGKTEVYLAAIAACLARGEQALVLLPEIALTPQALRRFRERLGVDVAALHSGLGEIERARAWLAVASGEAKVVLGTRSAVFVPLPRAGIIIVDEEHDASYKQQEGFRYHARDLAVLRAQALRRAGRARLGDAVAGNARERRGRALRVAAASAPRGTCAAAGAARRSTCAASRSRHGLAPATLDAIAAAIARGEQALIFKNRRGYAPVLLCHDCGWSAQCPALRARADAASGLRDACAAITAASRQPVPRACPICDGLALHPMGQGTERLEETLRARFPDVPIVRVDRDTTRGRRARDALLDQSAHGGRAHPRRHADAGQGPRSAAPDARRRRRRR